MTKTHWGSARLGLAVLGAGMLLMAAPAAAQVGTSGQEPAGEALSRNLRTLAANPKSLSSLMGAGKAALELGDAQAAITFFGRAEEIAPGDARIKMWIGSALVHLHQAQGALKFFDEAVRLGVAEAEVARDRGLARDIAGDPRGAQRDYRLALTRGPDAEVTRRLALSLAISGEREPALRLLEGQLAARDRSAQRARAFVLALTGDPAGASNAVAASMPGPQGSALMPFLERLPALGSADRALAVHLGHFPNNWRNLPVPPRNVYASADAAASAGSPDARQTALGTRAPAAAPKSAAKAPAPAPSEPGKQAQRREQTALAGVRQQQPAAQQQPAPQAKPEPVKTARAEQPPAPASAPRGTGSRTDWLARRGASDAPQAAPRRPAPEQAAAQPAPVREQPRVEVAASAAPAVPAPEARREPAQIASAQAAPAQPAPAPARQEPVQVASAETAPEAPGSEPVRIASAELPPSNVLAAPGFSIGAQETEPAPEPAPASADRLASNRLADVAAAVASLPQVLKPQASEPAPAKAAPAAAPKPAAMPAKKDPAPAAAAPAASKKDPAPAQAAAKKPAAPAAAAAKKPAAPAEPARHWVQVAGGADKSALPRTFAGLKAKAPKLLAARTAWTTPLRATNRLLVGPFKTDDEAQEFVNELRKAEISAFSWTSEAGQKIEKLGAK